MHYNRLTVVWASQVRQTPFIHEDILCSCSCQWHSRRCRSIWLADKTTHCSAFIQQYKQIHTQTCLTALFLWLSRWAGTRKVKLVRILLKQETVSGSGISWATCKSAPRSRQITMPAPHYSVLYRPDALPATQPTASKHWRQPKNKYNINKI